MNVSLTRELEQFVTKRVESGLYQTASEVVREGLRLLREREDMQQLQLAELRHEIALGLAEADEGNVVPFKPRKLLDTVRKQKHKRRAARP